MYQNASFNNKKNGRCIVIADCHGQPHLITNALKDSGYDKNDDNLVFAGDILDIGYEPEKCLDILVENNADIVCMSSDTEIYTKEMGWITYDKINKTHSVLSYTVDGVLKWDSIDDIYIFNYKGTMLNILSKSQDQLVTLDHYLLYMTGNKLKYRTAETLLGMQSSFNIPCAGYIDRCDYQNISDNMITICGLVISEGTYCNNGGIYIYQNEGEKSEYIRKLLRSENIKWSEQDGHNKYEKRFYIFKEYSNRIKTFIPNKLDASWFVKNLSPRQIIILIDSLLVGDGEKCGRFSTNNLKLAEQFQMLCMMCGHSASIKSRTRLTKLKKKIYNNIEHRIHCCKSQFHTIDTKKVLKTQYNGVVFDITTKAYGNFLARRNNMPFFTGNCGNHDVALITGSLIYPQNNFDYMLRERIIEMMNTNDIARVYNNVLITHAGLSEQFYLREINKKQHALSINEICSILNNMDINILWQKDGPLWYRPNANYNPPVPNIKQVVGHTPPGWIANDIKNLYVVDPYCVENFDKNRFRYAMIDSNGSVEIVDSNK